MKNTKNRIHETKSICKAFNKNGRIHEHYWILKSVSIELSEIISTRDKEYHEQLAKKLNHHQTSSKT